MKTRRFILIGTLLLCGLTLVVAYRTVQRVRLVNSQRLSNRTHLIALQNEIQNLDQRIREAKAAQSELEVRLESRRRASAALLETPFVQTNSPLPPTPFSPQEVLRKDPKLQLLYLKTQRAATAQRYQPLFKSLHLSPGQIDAFTDLAVRNAEQLIDIQGAAQTQELTMDDPGITSLTKSANDQMYAAQEALLGARDFEQLKEFERSLPARGAVDALAGRLVFGNDPLTPNQADQLTQIVANASRSYQNGGVSDNSVCDSSLLNFAPNGAFTPDGWRHPYPESFDWTKVFERARTVLTPTQSAVFEAMLVPNISAMAVFNFAQDDRLHQSPQAASP